MATTASVALASGSRLTSAFFFSAVALGTAAALIVLRRVRDMWRKVHSVAAGFIAVAVSSLPGWAQGITAILLLATLLFAWYLFATLYLVFRDDLMISMLTGQRRANYAYEDRIVELRSRIDKITARQLLNQESIEDRVAGLVARQAELEARQILVADLSTRADRIGLPVAVREGASSLPGIMTGSTNPPPGAIALPYADPTPRKPQPLPPEPMKPEPIQPPAQPKTLQNGFEAPKMRGPMDAVVQEIERRSGRMEKAQIETLADGFITPVSVTQVGDTAWVAEGQLGHLFDPALKDKQPKLPFRIVAVPLAAP